MTTIWDTATPFAGTPASWLSKNDGLRLGAYTLYGGLLANDGNSIRFTLREDEENPIFVPTAARIVKTKSRYVCKGLGFQAVNVTAGLGPSAEVPVEEDQLTSAIIAFGEFFNRETFFAKFRAAMTYGLAQGDWFLYLYADPLKPDGKRISCRAVDPSMVFPIFDPNDKERMVGVRLVEVIVIDNKDHLKVQTWLTARADGHPNYSDGEYVDGAEITYEVMVVEPTDWEDPLKRKTVTSPLTFPQTPVDGIFQLPIYHFKANDKPGEFYGVSDLAGLERVFHGVNQSVTDENVGLAMAALGVYVTTNTPVDAQGNPTDWVIGPKRVVEVDPDAEKSATDQFNRVPGITSIKPSQDHYKYLQDQAETTQGISDVALGEIESSIAESGIALALRFAPILDDAADKDEFILAKLRQLFHDLKDWFAAYESITLPLELEIVPVIGPKLPRDVDKDRSVYSDLHLAGIITTELYIEKLNELGFELGDPKALIAAVIKEQEENFKRQQEQQAQIDEQGARLADEAGGPPEDEAAA